MFSYLLINLTNGELHVRSANELMTYYYYFVIFIAFASFIGNSIKATSSMSKL